MKARILLLRLVGFIVMAYGVILYQEFPWWGQRIQSLTLDALTPFWLPVFLFGGGVVAITMRRKQGKLFSVEDKAISFGRFVALGAVVLLVILMTIFPALPLILRILIAVIGTAAGLIIVMALTWIVFMSFMASKSPQGYLE